jgi:methenyltetrahydrofolate cyclohydrolase
VTIGSQSLDSFLEELGSSAPVPGGGAASAVAGALSAGLVAMVAELSVGRPRYEPYADAIEFGRSEGRRLEKVMVDLADGDIAAFDGFMIASFLPRTSPEEAALRKAAVSAAARAAIEPPRLILAACAEVASAAERLAGRSNMGLASDLVVSSRLIEGAAHGAIANVVANLPLLADPGLAASIESEVLATGRSVSRLAQAARTQVAKRSLRDPEPALGSPIGPASKFARGAR